MVKKIEKYSASWCGPCRVLEKTLKEVLKDYPSIEFNSYDADEDEDKFEEMHITNVPQLYFYDENGTEIHHLIGAQPADKLKEIINSFN